LRGNLEVLGPLGGAGTLNVVLGPFSGVLTWMWCLDLFVVY